MTDPAPDATSEKPLDPAVLRIQKRVNRLMLIAALTFGIGLVTVLGAIIYRLATFPDKSSVTEVIPPTPAAAPIAPAAAVATTPPVQIVQATPSDPPAAPSASGEATAPAAAAPTSWPAVAKAMENVKAVLPARAWLVSASISGDRIVLAYEHANGTTMFVVDANTLEITGRLDLKPQ